MISALCFSPDGHWLISGSGSGDLKVWDTSIWAETRTLRGTKGEEPRALVVSRQQVWLVAAYSDMLRIYRFHPHWKLEKCVEPEEAAQALDPKQPPGQQQE